MNSAINAVELSLAARPDFPLDLAGIVPDAVAEQTPDAIRRLPLIHGSRRKRVGDFFDVAVKNSDRSAASLTVTTDGAVMNRLGAGMAGGRMDVRGDAGLLAGHDMSAGMLTVSGTAGDYAGSGMRGGRLDILGNAGSFVGAAHPNAMRGMNGGLIRVKGSAGDRLGQRMRRGVIVVHGAIGEYCASVMIAGTVVAFGPCGGGLGAGMRRGTVLALGSDSTVPPGFEDCGPFDFIVVELLARYLASFDLALGRRLRRAASGPLRRLAGDVAGGGMGELLLRPGAGKRGATA